MKTPVHTVNRNLSDTLISGFDHNQDAVHLHSGSVRRCFIKPQSNIPLDAAHMDGIQIIDKKDISPYALPLLREFSVTQTVVDGETTPIQCCFASDGLFLQADISDNTFKTSGTHFITINGLLSGTINNNAFSTGTEDGIKLYPARAGGNPDGKYNVWILSFKDAKFVYQPVECNTPDQLRDWRQVVFNKTDKFLIQFDYDKFEALAANVPAGGGREMGREFQRIALDCGTLVTEFNKPAGVIMQFSKQGKDVLIVSEGVRPDLHRDINGNESIGVGHKITDEEKASGRIVISGSDVPFYERNLTSTEVYALFAQDINSRLRSLNWLLDKHQVVLDQDQFDAIFNFYFNVGHGQFAGNDTRDVSNVWQHLLEGEFDAVPEAILSWNKSKGEVNQGMVNRRTRTVALWQGFGLITDVADSAPVAVPQLGNVVTALDRLTADVRLQPYPDVRTYLSNDQVPEQERIAWAEANMSEWWADAVKLPKVSIAPPAFTMPGTEFVGAAATNNSPPATEVHSSVLHSTTIQGIGGMLVSAAVAYATSKGWFDSALGEMVKPVVLEVFGSVMTLVSGWWAYRGRKNAKKGFKS